MVDLVSAWKGHDTTNQIGQLGLRWNRASDRSSGQEDNNRIVWKWRSIFFNKKNSLSATISDNPD